MSDTTIDFTKFDGLVCHQGKVSCFTKPIALPALPRPALEEAR